MTHWLEIDNQNPAAPDVVELYLSATGKRQPASRQRLFWSTPISSASVTDMTPARTQRIAGGPGYHTARPPTINSVISKDRQQTHQQLDHATHVACPSHRLTDQSLLVLYMPLSAIDIVFRMRPYFPHFTPTVQGDEVALRVQRRTSDMKVAGSTSARALLAQQP